VVTRLHRFADLLANSVSGTALESAGFPTAAVNSGGHWFEVDQDLCIRFQMNRDARSPHRRLILH
jgi:hypothetical protein